MSVYTMKTHPDSYGNGLWFELDGGKVYTCTGERDKTRKSFFTDSIDGEAARVILKLDGAAPEN